MNCTSKTLNNVCNAILNKPAKSVINEILIIQIKRLLINTKHPVFEIAYKVGFVEPNNMYRYFKKHTKYTPQDYRKTYTQ